MNLSIPCREALGREKISLPFRSTLAFVALVGLAGLGCQQKGGPLKVDRIEPAQGSTGGGDTVHIIGSGFEPGKTQVQIMFGRSRVEQVMIESSTKITVVTPVGDKGRVPIKLLFDNGSAFEIPDAFSFVVPGAGQDLRKAYFKPTEGAAPAAPKK